MIDIIKTSKFKATLLSIRAQLGQFVGAVVSFGVGFMIEHFSYSQGFLYLGIIFFLILFPFYLYIINRYKDINTALI